MANTQNLDLVKPAGTDHALISVINQNFDKIDNFAGKTNTSLAGVQDGIAIVSNGDTHAAIASGQFVYVKNHGSLAEGLYRATAAIATDAALSTSNLAADSSGGMNALKSDIDTLNSNIIITQKITVTTGAQGGIALSSFTDYNPLTDTVLYAFVKNSNANYYAVITASAEEKANYLVVIDSLTGTTVKNTSVIIRLVFTRFD